MLRVLVASAFLGADSGVGRVLSIVSKLCACASLAQAYRFIINLDLTSPLSNRTPSSLARMLPSTSNTISSSSRLPPRSSCTESSAGALRSTRRTLIRPVVVLIERTTRSRAE